MKIRGYMAASVDGFIADRDGGVGWLEPFQSVDSGYDAFLAGIGTVVFGRKTYDQVREFLGGWPYAGKRAIVVTSRPLNDAPDGVVSWSDDLSALIAMLRRDPGRDGDAWVVGGADLQSAFIELGALDTLDLFIVPVLLGDGVRMFRRSNPEPELSLVYSEVLGLGMVRLSYDLSGD